MYHWQGDMCSVCWILVTSFTGDIKQFSESHCADPLQETHLFGGFRDQPISSLPTSVCGIFRKIQNEGQAVGSACSEMRLERKMSVIFI
jgi:hypothetical protein